MKNTRKPRYIEIYENVRENIVKGVYKKGEKLPSKRTLSEDYGVSVVTVEHSYALLADEGYIDSMERSGYFVIYSDDESFGVYEEELKRGKTVYQTDEYAFPFSVISKAMRAVISDKGEALMEKSDNYGVVELREAISRYLMRSRGIMASPDRIIIGSGAEYIYGLLVELLGRDKIWGIEKPSYMKIEQVYRAKGIRLEKLALGSNGIKTSELSKSAASILHITPYRSFPSGVTATASKRHEYIKWANERGAVIIEDDFESEFTTLKKPEETLFSLSENCNVIYINTFSKTVSPSLRVAYTVLPEALFKEFEKKLSFYSCTVPTFEQYLISELISSGAFERHINSVRRKRRKNKGL